MEIKKLITSVSWHDYVNSNPYRDFIYWHSIVKFNKVKIPRHEHIYLFNHPIVNSDFNIDDFCKSDLQSIVDFSLISNPENFKSEDDTILDIDKFKKEIAIDNYIIGDVDNIELWKDDNLVAIVNQCPKREYKDSVTNYTDKIIFLKAISSGLLAAILSYIIISLFECS